VKTIVSDDAPLVTPALNEELRVRNEEKKTALREHKAKLAERRDDLRALSGFVEEGVYCGLLGFHTLHTHNRRRLQESASPHSPSIHTLTKDTRCTFITYSLATGSSPSTANNKHSEPAT
jgi:hypothetical protein